MRIGLSAILLCWAPAGLAAQAGQVDAVASPQMARPELDAMLAAVDGERFLEVAVHVALLDGEVLYDFRGDDPQSLASNTKILTTTAALMALEDTYRWYTEVYLNEDIVRVVGKGDPSLRRIGDVDYADRFARDMADSLKQHGKTTLSVLELDGRYFGDQVRHSGWPSNQAQATYCAPVSALSVEGGVLEVYISGDKVWTLPDVSQGMKIRYAQKRGQSISAWWGSQPNEIMVAPSLSGKEESVRFAVQDPQVLYAAWLKTALLKYGVTVEEVRHLDSSAAESSGELLLDWRSAWTLADVLVVTNKESDNFLAEVVLKTLGAERKQAGDYASGIAAIHEVLSEALKRDLTFKQADGSGLTRSDSEDLNTCTAEEMCAILRAMAEHPRGALFFDTLPIGGVDGSLKPRFKDAIFAPQRLHAKTGFILGASSLSGYLLLPDDRIAVFSFLVNFDRSKNKNTNNRRFQALQTEFFTQFLQEEA
ncbi:MAG: D-alanyl-D-alanine carboxypeptidase/D-alanyl-D-alanine-endopeptidase [Planctomycetota bacterium]|nr:D-alanyl-D-alanine carboxypeptidase/D-alanyl-D-alanine-endopeptidase [Planctomycetota bacterium]MDA1114175.1 D-alanyl-D-alanine carboxypeptidase/D-alanyl-D-alanine-endopeptidase [Planctomycetota bacterium]